MFKRITLDEDYYIEVKANFGEWYNGKKFVHIEGKLMAKAYLPIDSDSAISSIDEDVPEPFFKKNKWIEKCKQTEKDIIEDLKSELAWRKRKQEIDDNLYESLSELIK